MQARRRFVLIFAHQVLSSILTIHFPFLFLPLNLTRKNTQVFPVEESLRQKKDIYLSLSISLLFVWITYVLFGDAAALLYNESNLASNILLNLPSDSIGNYLCINW